jgi:formiminoglutamase
VRLFGAEFLPPPPGLFGPGHDPADYKLSQWARPVASEAEVTPGAVVLVGFPMEEGVRRNGGRPGASLAPRVIRQALYRLSAHDPEAGRPLAPWRLLDLGDLVLEPAGLEEAQAVLGQLVAALFRRRAIPVILGGGHETAFGHFLGHAECHRSPLILNVDAHLDVRERFGGLGHSGSPFRQALESPLPPRGYAVTGLEPAANSPGHAEWARARGASLRWLHEVADLPDAGVEGLLAGGEGPVMATIDIDAFHAGAAPGCSAPSPAGLTARQAVTLARVLGASPRVLSLDLVEVSPPLDLDGRTARLAALILWNFLATIARRPTPPEPC